jgi:hypothetical protein
MNRFDELSVGVFFLRLVDPVCFSEKLINTESHCRVTQLGKVAGHRLEVAGDAIVMMHDQYSRARFFSIRVGNVSGNTVFIGA